MGAPFSLWPPICLATPHGRNLATLVNHAVEEENYTDDTSSPQFKITNLDPSKFLASWVANNLEEGGQSGLLVQRILLLQ